ncbi:2-polyprenyl-6-methoxyphenol hydroxylase-like FAD-dependent oxidoreductase [Lentzea flaviverrucosa]|uniref:2-polyprenyl-6-methoxyphenol hydroxylase n=2 Tax=Lentzea flaviverrucosa TaxID=200379 RepID=A0A1H9XSD7_9PSEU|nr:2-polyprenyl-6-methoxyphenol hydroxylase-like FAD-dependent oxidoreductase [Lentzea flaviverrucosa]SES49051.1 2-polyprenyl-6-methoxyphenol hydroxylase [Lentzea flaviverrucosa]
MTDIDQGSRKPADVVIIGAGIIGLANALQLAKRGLTVTLIDNVRNQRRSFKVGESFLVFTSAFLRTIGELDDFISEESFIKEGVWFTSGAEHRKDFSGSTEWAVNADPHPPHYLFDAAEDKKWFRCMFLDMQIVRPEAEDVMRAAAHAHPRITFLDSARVREVDLAESDEPHQVHWSEGTEPGVTPARWVIDCSGRNRLLARHLDHTAEKRENDEGFQTTAVWAQFSGVTDDNFDERWKHLLENGRTTRRDLYTVHLWGDGYWIWVIRLSQGRVSVGATFDKRKPPPGANPREQFWNLMKRHPVLDDVVRDHELLEFRTFRNAQHWTDTFASERRYAMVGDAGSIIDAYYSQGIALALVTSWHLANVVQRDVHQGLLDRPYIARINRNTRQDWHMLRNMVREKYTSAVEDPRFFLLSHILDMAVFWCLGSTRAKLTRWLVDTEGDTSRETPGLAAVRKRLESRLFYSQSIYWRLLPPELVQRAQRRLQAGIAERARWRVSHGVRTPAITSVLTVTGPLPKVWRLPFASGQTSVNVSSHDFVEPAELRPAGTATWFDRLPISVNTRLEWVIRLRPVGLLATFAAGYLWDAADTAVRRSRHRRRTPAASGSARAEDQTSVRRWGTP